MGYSFSLDRSPDSVIHMEVKFKKKKKKTIPLKQCEIQQHKKCHNVGIRINNIITENMKHTIYFITYITLEQAVQVPVIKLHPYSIHSNTGFLDHICACLLFWGFCFRHDCQVQGHLQMRLQRFVDTVCVLGWGWFLRQNSQLPLQWVVFSTDFMVERFDAPVPVLQSQV